MNTIEQFFAFVYVIDFIDTNSHVSQLTPVNPRGQSHTPSLHTPPLWQTTSAHGSFVVPETINFGL